MRTFSLAVTMVGILLLGVVPFGCKSEEPEPSAVETAPAAPAPPAVPEPDTSAAKEAQTALDKVTTLIKGGKLDEAEKELAALEAKSGSLSPEMQAKIKAARASLDAAKTAAASAAAADAAAKEAQTSLDKVTALIKGGKLDEAEKELAALEAKSGSLSPEMQAKIKAARASLDAAKTAASAKESEGLLARILAMIKDGKLADAEKMLAELESKANLLPQSLQDKIKAARTALEIKKKTPEGLKIPGLGG